MSTNAVPAEKNEFDLPPARVMRLSESASTEAKITLNTRACLAAMFASFSVLGFEVLFYQQLQFLTDYPTATMIISIALLGISAGSLLSFLLMKWAGMLRSLALLLTGPVGVAGFLIATQVPGNVMALVVVMTFPFLFGAFVISTAFIEETKSGFVYASDLVGAGLGAMAAAVLIPHLREEGSILAIGTFVSLSSVLTLAPGMGKRRRIAFLLLALILVAGGVAALVLQLTEDRFNLAKISKAQKEQPLRSKIYSRPSLPQDISSYGSLVERIDIIKTNRGSYMVAYNGHINDKISKHREPDYAMDRRLPITFFTERIASPQVLVVGASAEGINKPVKLVAGETGSVTGLEYNAAITRAVLEERPELHSYGQYWYDGMNLRNEDARTFLQRTDAKFDIITMLNTHKVTNIGIEGPPEYLHTIPAVEAYLDHLTHQGTLVIEERNLTTDTDAGIHNYLATIAAALRQRGQKPEEHILAYEYYSIGGKSKSLIKRGIRRNDDYYSSKRYAIILVFKSAVAKDQKVKTSFNKWMQLSNFYRQAKNDCNDKDHCLNPIEKGCEFHWTLHQDIAAQWQCIKDGAKAAGCRCETAMGHFSIRMRHSPWRHLNTTYSKAITEPDPKDVLAAQGYIVRAATDDRPFVQDVDAKQPNIDKLLKITCGATAAFVGPLLLGILAFVLFRGRGKIPSPDRTLARVARITTIALIACIVGLAYLLVEVVLIQRFTMFMGSPASSLVLILPSMLIFSGVGGLLSQKMSSRFALASAAAIVLLAVLFQKLLLPALDVLVALPLAWRVIAAILLLAPMFIAMGVPFSFALKHSRQHFTPAFPVLLFGINGAFGAIATPAGLKLSMTHGFDATMKLGAALYGAVILLLLVIVWLDNRKSRMILETHHQVE